MQPIGRRLTNIFIDIFFLFHTFCDNDYRCLFRYHFRDENEITRGQLERDLELKKMLLEHEKAKLRLKRVKELNECLADAHKRLVNVFTGSFSFIAL